MADKKNKKKTLSKGELEEALIDNFVGLQKVLTNLSVKFEDLSKNLSRLLQLFEISAKSFAEKGPGNVDQEFLKRLDSLLDQNKVISKGIMLMEEKVRNKMSSPGPSGIAVVPSLKSNDPRFGMIRSRPLR